MYDTNCDLLERSDRCLQPQVYKVSTMHVGEKCLAMGEYGPLEHESAEPPGVRNCRGSDSTVKAQEIHLVSGER